MIDFAATAPAGNSVARNDTAINAASERVVIAITNRFIRFSCESGLIDPESTKYRLFAGKSNRAAKNQSLMISLLAEHEASSKNHHEVSRMHRCGFDPLDRAWGDFHGCEPAILV